MTHVAADADLQHVLMDSTVVRAHACAAGAKKTARKRTRLGVPEGGFSTKVHALTDALGSPLRFILTGGQESDIGQAANLLAGIQAAALLADKGYDADALLNTLRENQMNAVIPPKANRTVQRSYDAHLYKERHLIECFLPQGQASRSARSNIIAESFLATRNWQSTT